MSSLDFEIDGPQMRPEGLVDHLERRWFAADSACTAQLLECESICRSLELVAKSWSQARSRLLDLEALRDALGEQLAHADAESDRAVMSNRGQLSGMREGLAAGSVPEMPHHDIGKVGENAVHLHLIEQHVQYGR